MVIRNRHHYIIAVHAKMNGGNFPIGIKVDTGNINFYAKLSDAYKDVVTDLAAVKAGERL